MFINEIIGGRPLYVTRMWGFSPETWGAVTFPHEGTVDRWVNELSSNVFVLCFASHIPKEEVRPEDRGRVFGIYEIEPKKSYYKDEGIMDSSHFKDANCFRENGEYRWPWVLNAVRAWEFTDKPVLTREALPNARILGMEISTNMQLLHEDDLKLIGQYQLEEVNVYGCEPLLQLKLPNEEPDTNYHFLCENESILKLMPKWKKGDVLFKPSITHSVEARLKDFNDHPLAHLFGVNFRSYWSKRAGSKCIAEEREQRMLEKASESDSKHYEQ